MSNPALYENIIYLNRGEKDEDPLGNCEIENSRTGRDVQGESGGREDYRNLPPPPPLLLALSVRQKGP